MSMEPIEQTNRIYDFMGMKISPEIEEFLKKSTTTQDLESNHRNDQKFMQIYTTSVSLIECHSVLIQDQSNEVVVMIFIFHDIQAV